MARRIRGRPRKDGSPSYIKTKKDGSEYKQPRMVAHATAKRVRVNREKTALKVLKAVIENPLDNINELSEKTGLCSATVSKVLSRLETKELRLVAMESMVAKDCAIQEIIQDEIIERLEDKEKRSDLSIDNLTKIGEFSFKRSQLLDGKPTENVQQIITSVVVN